MINGLLKISSFSPRTNEEEQQQHSRLEAEKEQHCIHYTGTKIYNISFLLFDLDSVAFDILCHLHCLPISLC